MAFDKYNLLKCNIDCGDGWKFLVDYILDLAASDILFAEYDLLVLQKYHNPDPELLLERKEFLEKTIEEAPHIISVTERQGCLIIHTSQETPELRGAINMAMLVSKHICELCGNRATLNIKYERTRCRICNA